MNAYLVSLTNLLGQSLGELHQHFHETTEDQVDIHAIPVLEFVGQRMINSASGMMFELARDHKDRVYAESAVEDLEHFLYRSDDLAQYLSKIATESA